MFFIGFIKKKTRYSQVKRLQSYGCGATEPGRCCYYPFAKMAVPWRVGNWAGNSWMKWWHLETLGETHGLGGFFFVGVKRSNFWGGRFFVVGVKQSNFFGGATCWLICCWCLHVCGRNLSFGFEWLINFSSIWVFAIRSPAGAPIWDPICPSEAEIESWKWTAWVGSVVPKMNSRLHGT